MQDRNSRELSGEHPSIFILFDAGKVKKGFCELCS